MRVIGGSVDTASPVIQMIWNINVSLPSIVYFAFGYYLKDIWMEISKRWMIVRLIDSVTVVFHHNFIVIDYHLGMNFSVLELVIPFSFRLVFVGVLYIIATSMALLDSQHLD